MSESVEIVRVDYFDVKRIGKPTVPLHNGAVTIARQPTTVEPSQTRSPTAKCDSIQRNRHTYSFLWILDINSVMSALDPRSFIRTATEAMLNLKHTNY